MSYFTGPDVWLYRKYPYPIFRVPFRHTSELFTGILNSFCNTSIMAVSIGHQVEPYWIFGSIDLRTRRGFLQVRVVPDRTQATLLIKKVSVIFIQERRSTVTVGQVIMEFQGYLCSHHLFTEQWITNTTLLTQTMGLQQITLRECGKKQSRNLKEWTAPHESRFYPTLMNLFGEFVDLSVILLSLTMGPVK